MFTESAVTWTEGLSSAPDSRPFWRSSVVSGVSVVIQEAVDIEGKTFYSFWPDEEARKSGLEAASETLKEAQDRAERFLLGVSRGDGLLPPPRIPITDRTEAQGESLMSTHTPVNMAQSYGTGITDFSDFFPSKSPSWVELTVGRTDNKTDSDLAVLLRERAAEAHASGDKEMAEKLTAAWVELNKRKQ